MSLLGITLTRTPVAIDPLMKPTYFEEVGDKGEKTPLNYKCSLKRAPPHRLPASENGIPNRIRTSTLTPSHVTDNTPMSAPRRSNDGFGDSPHFGDQLHRQEEREDNRQNDTDGDATQAPPDFGDAR
jgi:hypothetical protein